MERTPVKSTSIKSAGYDAENRILEIEFHSKLIYDYFDVSWEIYEKFITARQGESTITKTLKIISNTKE